MRECEASRHIWSAIDTRNVYEAIVLPVMPCDFRIKKTRLDHKASLKKILHRSLNALTRDKTSRLSIHMESLHMQQVIIWR